MSAYMRVNRDKNTKTVLFLRNQKQSNEGAKLFVFREDEVRVRRRGETRRVEAETWHQPRRSLRPDAKATIQIAQRAIAPPTVSWSAPVGANLRLRLQSSAAVSFPVLRIKDYRKSPMLLGVSGFGGSCSTSFLNIGSNAGTSFVIASHNMPKSIPE